MGALAALLLIFAFVAVALIGGCGGDGEAQGAQRVAGPQAFADDATAELAANGDRALWMVVSGYRGKLYQAKVFRKEGGGWQAITAPPGHVSDAAPVNIEVARVPGFTEPAPCLGFTEITTGQPVFTCWWEDAWHALPDPGLGKGAQLLGTESREGTLTALFQTRPTPSQSAFRVVQLDSQGWSELGAPIVGPAALAQLGEAGTGAEGGLAVGIETQSATPSRYVLVLRGDAWQKVGETIRGPGIGPLLSGPAVLGRSVLFPVVDAEEEPWSFLVHPVAPGSASKGAPKELSNDTGNAQGRLDSVGEEVWASWQEDEELRSGQFKARIFAARLNARGGVVREVPLWSGVSVGPGSTQVIEFRGRLYALYLRGASPKDSGLQATVAPIAGG